MKKSLLLLLVMVVVSVSISVSAWADPVRKVAESVVKTFTEGCEKELKTYCKDVTPGEARLLACIYAHEDKLSSKCDYALYDSAAQLERAVSTLTYVVNECAVDIQTLCAEVPAGQGLIKECLDENEKKVSERCKDAQKVVGLND